MARFDVKIVLVGDTQCGKTCLLHRFVHQRYNPDLPPTYGTEFGAKRVQVQGPMSSSSSSSSSGGTRSASVGVWDTSGASRFHSLSRRFLPGADAVVVCWDPTKRASWDSLKAWVHDARTVEPSARIFLAACKSDLLEMPHQQRRLEGASSAEKVPAGQAGGSPGGEQLQLGVSVERWQGARSNSGHNSQPARQPSSPEAEAGSQGWTPHQGQRVPHHDFYPQKQQQQQQQQAAEVAAAGGAAAKPPPTPAPSRGRIAGGAGGGRGEAPPPAAPTTPMRAAERPQSPGGQGPPALPGAATVPAEVALHAGPGGRQRPVPPPLPPPPPPPPPPVPQLSAGQQVLADHAAAAAAELVASLTGQELPSPFAAVATAPALESAAPSPEPGQAGRARGDSGASRRASSSSAAGRPGQRAGGLSPAASPQISIPAPAEWEVLDEQGSVRPCSRAGSRQQGPEKQLQPLAVPPAAVHQFCAANGAPMLWLSACSGEGVAAAFTAIAQEVLSLRWQRHRWLHPQHQTQQGARVGRSTPRRSATAAPAVGAPLPAVAAGAGSAAPPLAMSRQPPRSADSRVLRQQQLLRYGEAVAGSVAEAGEGASRGRARSVSPSPPGGEVQREYIVGGSQLGRPRAPEEQSCRIA